MSTAVIRKRDTAASAKIMPAFFTPELLLLTSLNLPIHFVPRIVIVNPSFFIVSPATD
jgi:hypothetical protein